MQFRQERGRTARSRATAELRLRLSLVRLGLAALCLAVAVWALPAVAHSSATTVAGEASTRAPAGPLWVLGTDGNDLIRIAQGTDGSLTITVNGSATVVAAADVPRLIIDGLEGNDRIIADPGVTAPLTILDGPGNDVIVGGAETTTSTPWKATATSVAAAATT